MESQKNRNEKAGYCMRKCKREGWKRKKKNWFLNGRQCKEGQKSGEQMVASSKTCRQRQESQCLE